jgi:hypothetical protein
MESAVESGKLASNFILEKYNLKKCLVINHDINIGKIDDPFYVMGLPHVIDCFFITLVLFILFKTVIPKKFLLYYFGYLQLYLFCYQDIYFVVLRGVIYFMHRLEAV